jgi:ABC-type Zn uptake system ZnuABC Zn-binding protein ZnuA
LHQSKFVRAGLVGLVIAAAALVAVPALAATHVVATTTDLAALVGIVGGDLVTVESIVPAGADPEAFEPRPGDLGRLRRADLIVRVGLGYDYWLDALVKQTGERRLLRGGDAYLDASIGIPLLEIRGQSVVNEGGHAHGVANPHYWLDPENAIIVTAAIAEALVRINPGQRETILANRDAFLAELEMRRERWVRTLAPFVGTRLIAYHNSWPYFARRFRLDVIAFIEPKAGVAPSPAHLAQLISAGRAAQVRAILHEPYEPEDGSRYVARKLSVPMVRLAVSVGSVDGTGDYLALFDYNVATLAKALGARSP